MFIKVVTTEGKDFKYNAALQWYFPLHINTDYKCLLFSLSEHEMNLCDVQTALACPCNCLQCAQFWCAGPDCPFSYSRVKQDWHDWSEGVILDLPHCDWADTYPLFYFANSLDVFVKQKIKRIQGANWRQILHSSCTKQELPGLVEGFLQGWKEILPQKLSIYQISE